VLVYKPKSFFLFQNIDFRIVPAYVSVQLCCIELRTIERGSKEEPKHCNEFSVVFKTH